MDLTGLTDDELFARIRAASRAYFALIRHDDYDMEEAQRHADERNAGFAEINRRGAFDAWERYVTRTPPARAA